MSHPCCSPLAVTLDRFTQIPIIVDTEPHLVLDRHMKDKRRFQRWDCAIPCQLESIGQRYRGQISNLSLGGAFITDAELAPLQGLHITITFRVRGEHQLALRARIVRCATPDSFGVEFYGDSKERIQRLAPILAEVESRGEESSS